MTPPVATSASPGTQTQSSTSGSGTGATFTLGTGSQVAWSYCGPNLVTSDPSLTQPAWSASHAYSLGAQVLNSGNVYGCIVAGTSAASGGPTGSGTVIADSSVTWTTMGVYVQSPYLTNFWKYTYTTGATPPSVMTNAYGLTYANVGAVNAYSVTSGTNYSIGQTITLTGGTETSNAVFKVLYLGLGATPTIISGGSGYAVNDIVYWPVGAADAASGVGIATALTVTSVSSGAITGVSVANSGRYTSIPSGAVVQASTSGSGTGSTFSAPASLWGVSGPLTVATPGTYTVLPASPASQGATSGSGMGCTVAVNWPDPSWCNLIGCYNGGEPAGANGGWIIPYVYQEAPNTTPAQNFWAYEFMSDAPSFYFTQNSTLSTTDPGLTLSVDNHLLFFGKMDTPNGYSTQNYYAFTAPSAGTHLYRVEGRAGGWIAPPAVPTGYSVWAPSKAGSFLISIIGDSLEQGSAYGPYISGNGVAQRLARKLGVQMRSVSLGGTGILAGGPVFGNNSTFGQRILEEATHWGAYTSMGCSQDRCNDTGYSSSAILLHRL